MIRICMGRNRISLRIDVKIQELWRLRMEVVDAQSGGKRLKIEPWGIGRQVIAVSHNFEEERFLDPISGSTPK
jgi:hypothetical protein